MEPENKKPELDAFYTVSEVAQWLRMSERTVRRLVKLNKFEFLSFTPHEKRPQPLFTNASIEAYKKKYGTPAERPKRAYHRTVKKYARQKKKKAS